MVPLKRIVGFTVLSVFLFQAVITEAQKPINDELYQWEFPFSFIENKGQFDGRHWQSSKIAYGIDYNGVYVFFTKEGLTYRFDQYIRNPGRSKERPHEPKRICLSELLSVTWVGANDDVEIIASEKIDPYYSYAIQTKGTWDVTNENFISGYMKLTYKNLYDNIDVEYEIHPGQGIKYNLYLHPGADISQVKMKYEAFHTNHQDEYVEFGLTPEGEVFVKSSISEISELSPVAFYGDNQESVPISFTFENNILSFDVQNYDNSRMFVIDPWIVSPTFNSSTAVWEVETDASGNVYVIGGETPMRLNKYNSAGTLQWSYATPWDTAGYWLGTLATDDLGTSYITAGTAPRLQRINTAGTMVWNASGYNASCEYWSITFNCDNTRLLVGGTYVPGIFSFDFSSVVYDIDVNNGSVGSFQTFDTVNIGGFGVFPIEIRGISASKNAKYNFLTHEDVGLIIQNFGLCPNSAPLYKVPNGHSLAYKCENYLPATQNGGGLKAIISNDNYVYTHSGSQIHRRNLSTGALINSVSIPGGNSTTSLGKVVVRNSGLDVDDCGNVYVGSGDRVVKFDQNLNILAQEMTGFTVYDVSVNTNGEVIAVGAVQNNSATNRDGKIQSINMSCCAQYDPSCCDATICPVTPVCDTDPAFNLIANTAGGTWSGTGITNTTTGTFDPSVSGVGTFWVYYTLPCGMDSIQVTVLLCDNLVVCMQTNGDLTVTGGAGPYTWQYWQPAQTTPITNQTECQACGYTWTFGTCLNGMFPVTTCNSPAGWATWATGTTVPPPPNYPIQVLDSGTNSSEYTDSTSIPPCSACPPLTINITNVVHVSCYGGTNGSFTVTTTAGTSPYDYVLLLGATTVATYNNVAGSQNFTGLGAGTYTLNVTDDANCPGTITVVINQPTEIMPGNPLVTNATCGMSNGSASMSASGGTPGYTFTWSTSPVQTGATASNLPAGTYTVTITDNNGCTATTQVTVNDQGGPTVSATGTDATCGNSDGSATASPSGGTPPYGYAWNTTPPQNTQTASNIPAGTYTVTVTDDNGCTATASVTINDIGAPTVVVAGTDANCGNADGSATATATGGIPPYTYNWNTTPPQTGATATGLPAGTYSVTVTDDNGCAAVGNVTIGDTPPPTVSVSGIDANCGFNDGSATATPAGGTAPYTYEWDCVPPQTGQTMQNVPGGNYSVTVTDDNGCTATASIVLNNVGGPTLQVSSTPALCGQPTGTATVNVVAGGPGPYTYEWNTTPPQFTQTATGLAPGTYSVEVDDGLCSGFASVTVGDSIVIVQINITNIIDASCGNPTGSATAEPVNGTAPYSYLWSSSPAQTSQTLINVSGGSYSVTVTDDNGCSGTASVLIGDTPGPSLTVSSTNEMCGQANGTATVSVAGGTGTYTYNWSNGETTETISNLTSGNYSVTVYDGPCSGTASVFVGSTPGPLADFVAYPSVANPGDDINFSDNSTGNVIDWQWDFGDNSPWGSGSHTTHSYNQSGQYMVMLIVTDSNGCTDTTWKVVTIKDVLTIYFPNSFSPNNDGINDGFSPIGTNVDPDDFEMFIFDRWGELIYYTDVWGITTAQYPWNGTRDNAGTYKDAKMDVYVYRVFIKELDGNKKEYLGIITLIK